MQNLAQVLNNHILLVALAACLIAQLSKLLLYAVQHRRFNGRVLIETGGMPSSHSALVTALATGVGQRLGWDSPDFAIAVVFAVIVMYDAAGVRQAAGKQARVLNQMIDAFFHEEIEFDEARLKELLGHTPFQVVIGSALGVAVACLLQGG
ncbi:divergent PAP2 family protein [Phormidium yuhuli AB48]|uniref:Divergent PAP2 family protein n=1 Tax=Phormidium yuhuli AB48 TaxID=2940671 RepID=A0ABY5AR18_9CYAN|nr:divergent PAP2 family protein [Phormidium yuhuli]USR91460.1 divergent PAP2 family protein [Phormidium yuhuli AB48]